MSQSSAVHINPGPSKVFLRFLVILYLYTLFLLYEASLPNLLKVLLFFYLLWQFSESWRDKSLCPQVKEIKCLKNQWVIFSLTGEHREYEDCRIMIHNELFQVIRLRQDKKNKILILFNDQIPKEKLRLLHLKQLKT
ncbi:MAG: hypothetical protein EPN84_04960 [Legionella sp.]|nr:MAG: hypothetical protein EPN84_04960 [Legionella sp.]